MNASLWLVAPILIPLVTAIACLVFFAHPKMQRALSLLGNLALLVATTVLFLTVSKNGMIVTQLGNWKAPFGISFVADTLSASLVWVGSFIALFVSLFSFASLSPSQEGNGYHPLSHLMVMGCLGSFLTGDLFNLYVWFEVLLLASFGLVCLGNTRAQQEGTLKYVVLNLIGSTFFLLAIGLLYRSVGSLNMADVAQQIRVWNQPGLSYLLPVLFLVAFAIKAGAFPLYAWLPESYPVASPPAAGLFAALLTKVGVYAILRTFSLVFLNETPFTHYLIMTLGILTMVFGVLSACIQKSTRRILSVHIVSQVGYMLAAIAILTPLSLAAALFYIVHNMVVKTGLFLISGAIERKYGTTQLEALGGLAKTDRFLTAAFLLLAFSLAGVPPLSGFWAKFLVIRAALQLEHWQVAFVAIAVSLLTLFSMQKIWSEVFWKPATGKMKAASLSGSDQVYLYLPIAALLLFSLWLGLGVNSAFKIAQRAGAEISEPSYYIRTVLGEKNP